MVETVLWVRYPRGKLPVKGCVCTICGADSIDADDAQQCTDLARDLGLFGIESDRTRSLLKVGNSVAVSLDPQLIRDVLGGAKPGDQVRVGRHGKRIVIEREDA